MTALPTSPFGGSAVLVGNRFMIGVPSDAAGRAVSWAESLEQSGFVEEYTLGPVTLEDVYVALVGGKTAGAGARRGGVRCIRCVAVSCC